MKKGDLVRVRNHNRHGGLMGVVTHVPQSLSGCVKVMLLKTKKVVSMLKTNLTVISEAR